MSLSAHKDLQIPVTYPNDQVKTPVMDPDMAMVKEVQIESERYREVAEIPDSPAYSLIENEERMSEQQNQKLKTVKNKDNGMDTRRGKTR